MQYAAIKEPAEVIYAAKPELILLYEKRQPRDIRDCAQTVNAEPLRQSATSTWIQPTQPELDQKQYLPIAID